MIINRAVLQYAVTLAILSLPVLAQAPPQPADSGYYPPQGAYQQQAPYQQPPPYQPQGGYQQQQAPSGPRMSPQDLSNLVAPVALYPDLLLSQVLAASTYPAEIQQAQQWMQGNPGLRGRDLVEAAKSQNWDPSVQALVAFPDVMNMLTRDMQWTTDLGNAFLSQQADVMDAIQRLRFSARDNGRLTNTSQQRLTYQQENGQNAIVIQPTDPQVVYPPVYNPMYVWGQPAYGYYPPLAYPSPGFGITYAVGTFLGALFTGLLSFGGWGWGLSWLTHGLFLNGLFFSHFGFHGYGGYGFHGGPGYARAAWVHNPSHRLGVPYGNHFAGGHYAGAAGGRGFGGFSNYGGGANSASRSYNTGRGGFAGSSYAGSSRQAEAYRGLSAGSARGEGYNGGYSSGFRGASAYQARSYAPNSGASRNYANVASQGSYRGGYGGGSASAGHGFSAPSSHYSAPKSSGHSGGGGHFGGGGHSHSSGGGHSGGGGHSHSGGGHKK